MRDSTSEKSPLRAIFAQFVTQTPQYSAFGLSHGVRRDPHVGGNVGGEGAIDDGTPKGLPGAMLELGLHDLKATVQ
jgi:hypothetical protein